MSCCGLGRLSGGKRFGESPKKGTGNAEAKRKEEFHDLRIPERKESERHVCSLSSGWNPLWVTPDRYLFRHILLELLQ